MVGLWPAREPADRPEPHRPWQARHQTPPRRRPRGVPLALAVTGANRHDSVVFEALVDVIPVVPGLPGRPRSRPDKLHADKGYLSSHGVVGICVSGASTQELHAATSRRTIASASIVGLSNARMPGLPG